MAYKSNDIGVHNTMLIRQTHCQTGHHSTLIIQRIALPIKGRTMSSNTVYAILRLSKSVQYQTGGRVFLVAIFALHFTGLATHFDF